MRGGVPPAQASVRGATAPSHPCDTHPPPRAGSAALAFAEESSRGERRSKVAALWLRRVEERWLAGRTWPGFCGSTMPAWRPALPVAAHSLRVSGCVPGWGVSCSPGRRAASGIGGGGGGRRRKTATASGGRPGRAPRSIRTLKRTGPRCSPPRPCTPAPGGRGTPSPPHRAGGWRSFHVAPRERSRRERAVEARSGSTAPAPRRSLRWISASFAEA